MTIDTSTNGRMYTCPMHPEIRQNKPGSCPKCGMQLVEEKSVQKPVKQAADGKSFWATYQPLFTIVGLIVLGALGASWNMQQDAIDWTDFMQNWMAGFFLVFAGFKLLNLPGFAKGYAQYDLLAKYWKGYGYIYPFAELLLGMLYLQIPENIVLNVCTFALMTFSGLGVAIKLAKRERFQCACLGTVIDVPLTKVTLVEDFGMAAMAGMMIVQQTIF